MATNDGLKVFLMTAQLIEEDLDAIEQDLALDLGRERNAGTGEAMNYYPQIEHAFRAEAKAMAPHYEIFYSLERTAQAVVESMLDQSNVSYGPSSAEIRSVIQRVATGQLLGIDNISAALQFLQP